MPCGRQQIGQDRDEKALLGALRECVMVFGRNRSQLGTYGDQTRARLVDGSPELVEVMVDRAGRGGSFAELSRV